MDQKGLYKCPRCGRGVFAAEHPGAPPGRKFAECQHCRYFILGRLITIGRPPSLCQTCKPGTKQRQHSGRLKRDVSDTLLLDTDCAKLVCVRCSTVALELPKEFLALL